MNEELNTALNEVMKTILDAKDFTIEQAPDVIHQLIQFTILTNAIGMIVSIFIWWLSYSIAFKWTDQECQSGGDWKFGKFISCLIGGFTSVGFFITFIESFNTLIKAVIAPKLFLLEYAANLIK